MTLNIYPNADAQQVHISQSNPTGTDLVSLMRIDRNGRQLWTLADLGGPWSGFLYDRTAALSGDVEYVATYSNGTRESNTRTIVNTDPRPRLLRLQWSPDGTGRLIAGGAVWTEHDAVIDAAYDLEGISTITRRGVAGVHATANKDRVDSGRLTIWVDRQEHAAMLRADLSRHPLQWLRLADQNRMDHALIVETIGVAHETGAWTVSVGYSTRPDLAPAPDTRGGTIGRRTLADLTGDLAGLAADHDMLAELR